MSKSKKYGYLRYWNYKSFKFESGLIFSIWALLALKNKANWNKDHEVLSYWAPQGFNYRDKYNRAGQIFFRVAWVELVVKLTKLSHWGLVPVHLLQNWSCAFDLKFENLSGFFCPEPSHYLHDMLVLQVTDAISWQLMAQMLTLFMHITLMVLFHWLLHQNSLLDLVFWFDRAHSSNLQ